MKEGAILIMLMCNDKIKLIWILQSCLFLIKKDLTYDIIIIWLKRQASRAALITFTCNVQIKRVKIVNY